MKVRIERRDVFLENNMEVILKIIFFIIYVSNSIFDLSAKVLILPRMWSLSPERIDGDNDTSVESSFTHVSKNIFLFSGCKVRFTHSANF